MMYPFLNSCPPPDYVKQTRTAAWLRLGKIAALSILAALSVAVGLALPAGKDAEAQGVSVHQGYTYTQRYCQELGRQPRRYNVREPIAGSDWRNDGGWAIVLIRSQAAKERTGITLVPLIAYLNSTPKIDHPPNIPKTLRIDYRDGKHGYLWLTVTGTVRISGDDDQQAVIDLDQDGDVDNDDRIAHPLNPALMVWQQYIVRSVTYAEPYGATYTRWANMLWCR